MAALIDAIFLVSENGGKYQKYRQQVSFPPPPQVIIQIDGRDRVLDLFESVRDSRPVYIETPGKHAQEATGGSQ